MTTTGTAPRREPIMSCRRCEVEWRRERRCFCCHDVGIPGRLLPLLVYPPEQHAKGPMLRPGTPRTALRMGSAGR